MLAGGRLLGREWGGGGRRCLATAAKSVRIVEVGPRDGLQNEKTLISTEDKLELIDRLQDAGLNHIECTSFVSPKWIPQMADHSQIMRRLAREPGKHYPCLVPNEKGLEIAIRAKVEEIAVFASASETFSKKNLNCSIAESLERFGAVAKKAAAARVRVRGYVSCMLGCPYEGRVEPDKVLRVAMELMSLGCYELSMADTIGVGTPGSLETVLGLVLNSIPASKLALHCHDTYGQALANNLRGLQMGIRTFDSSIAGLGGCPYAAGATGNVATEDLVYMLHGLGYETVGGKGDLAMGGGSGDSVSGLQGTDLDALIATGAWVSALLGRPPQSRVTLASLAKQEDPEADKALPKYATHYYAVH